MKVLSKARNITLSGSRPLAVVAAWLALAGVGHAGQFWDWQLSDPYDLTVDAQILVIEPDDLSATEVRALKARGVTPICYLSVGTSENYRDDADQFPAAILGNTLGNWPNERYVDVRRTDILVPIMTKRFKACADKGFTGIEGDNIDAFENDNGLGLTIEDAAIYTRTLIDIAHSMGLNYAQKNAPELVPALVDHADLIIVEECFQYRFCEDILPYREAGKLVLSVEFFVSKQDWNLVCQQAKDLGFHTLIKDKDVLPGGRVCD